MSRQPTSRPASKTLESRLAHVLQIGMIARADKGEAKASESDPIEFNFDSDHKHSIFNAGPDANHVVINFDARSDLTVEINKLVREVKEFYEIKSRTFPGLKKGEETITLSGRHGERRFVARVYDAEGFKRYIEGEGRKVPVNVWSAFRRLVMGFVKINEDHRTQSDAKVPLVRVASGLLFTLDMAARSSGFEPGNNGNYVYDESYIMPYTSFAMSRGRPMEEEEEIVYRHP